MIKRAAIACLMLFGAWSSACLDSGASDELLLTPYTDPAFSENPYWFDGTAELNFYRTTISFYGQPRHSDQVVHIVVTEDHDPQQLVKADDWRQPGLLKMLKLNELRTVQTGVYEYRQMMSAFFDHAGRTFAKMTYGSQEWCGSSFKEILNHGDRSGFSYHTYWDGQASGTFDVDFPREIVPYDTLPLQLRMLRWTPGQEIAVRMLPSQFSSKVARPELQVARLFLEKEERIEVPMGTFESHVVRVEVEGRTDRLWFEKSFPHRMLRWETSGGDLFELRASKKLPYWRLHDLGDETHLPN